MKCLKLEDSTAIQTRQTLCVCESAGVCNPLQRLRHCQSPRRLLRVLVTADQNRSFSVNQGSQNCLKSSARKSQEGEEHIQALFPAFDLDINTCWQLVN